MHTNSFFSPRDDHINFNSQSRASSLFSKQSQFGQNNNTAFQKNRPVSVSKSIPGSTENELMKWIPLIKMVRKIQSRVRKDYLFLWCRLQTMTGIKQKIKDSNKQNYVQKANLFVLPSQIKPIPKIANQTSKSLPLNQTPSPNMITDVPKQKTQSEKDTKNKQWQQKSLLEKEKQAAFSQKKIPTNMHIPKLVDILEGFLKMINSKKIRESFMMIRSFSNKKLSIEKFQKIQFKQSRRNNLFNPLRMIKKHSHDIMKAEILGNTIKNVIKNAKISTIRYLMVKPKEIKENTEITPQKQINLAELQPEFSKLEIEAPTPKPSQFLAFSSSKQSNLKSFEKKHTQKPVEIQVKPNSSKPLKLKIKNSLQHYILPILKFRQDRTISKTFQNEIEQERMKKLNRIYPQEPFFEFPDISEITLFNSVINSNPVLNQLASPQSSHKNFNFNLQSQMKSQEQTMRTKQSIPCLQMSPRFEDKFQEDEPEPVKQRTVQKSRSTGKIIYLKYSNSTNLKNNPQTPSSTKKLVGMFSKKKSVELFGKDSITKNYESKISSCKSSILKKCDILAEVKPQKVYESNTKKIRLMCSKEKYKGVISASNRKADKQNIDCQELCKPQSGKVEENHKSSCNRQKSATSSKVVEKFMDLSAKRLGTTKKQHKTSSKKQNQILYSNDKSSSKKALNNTRNHCSKQNQLSEFNTLSSKKIISYQEFMKMYPGQIQGSSGRKPLMEISENEPIFEPIQITEQDYASKELDMFYQSCSAQLPREKQEMGENRSKKLRSKIDKMELNTARKMKMEIENMINQRKKSSIGVLKF